MFRNRGIDYRFPRSSGGRFFSARIDEARTGIVINWAPPASAPADPTDEIWSWNKMNLNEFSSGSIVYLGNVTGTITPSYFSGSAAYGRRTVPSVVFNYSSNFQTPKSGGMGIIQIEPGFPLPKRYELIVSLRGLDAGGGDPYFGLYFGANQITGTATGSFYASALLFGQNLEPAKSFNITSGAVGLVRPQKGNNLIDDTGVGRPHVLRVLVETVSTTGSALGPQWRAILVGPANFSVNSVFTTGFANETSGSNSTWVGAGKIDRIGLFIGRTASGSVDSNSGDTFELHEITIRKHPLES